MYKLNFYKPFLKKLNKLVKINSNLRAHFEKIFKLLEQDPFCTTLKTHKVIDKLGRLVYSSRVTSDIRIIWYFYEDEPKILNLINLGGHSGSNKVYK